MENEILQLIKLSGKSERQIALDYNFQPEQLWRLLHGKKRKLQRRSKERLSELSERLKTDLHSELKQKQRQLSIL